MNDLDLVKKCLERDEGAWRLFFTRFKSLIERRIKQIFARYNYQHGETQFLMALDYVLDQFLFNRSLDAYKKDLSLEAFVRTVTTRAVIDWYRKSTADKRFFGALDNPVLGVPDEIADHLREGNDGEKEVRLTTMAPEEGLIVRLLLLRHEDLAADDLTLLARISGRGEAEVRSRVDSLQLKLQNANVAAEEQFARLQLLFFQVQALNGRPDQNAKRERKEKQYRELLASYQKRGFEILPTRSELAELCNWDINKVDRSLRKIRDQLGKKANDAARAAALRLKA